MERWKLRREAAVLANQLASPVTFFTNRISKWHHDRTKSDRIRLTDGALPQAAALAVFLIYQPKGIPASLLHTCRFLAAQGIAPLVVANAPLSETDRHALSGIVWRIMERPNFGYDFGGYRDGILHLFAEDAVPETLFLLNDSIWFPVFPDSDLIARLWHLPADVVSPVVAGFKHRPGATFLHSYLMRFSQRALGHKGFLRYWQDLPMSNNKMAVVRGGEKRLAIQMERLGLTTAAIWGWKDVAAEITRLPEDEFRLAAEFAAQTYSASGQYRMSPEFPASFGPDQRQALVQRGYFGRDVLKAHPAVTVGGMGLPFVKKLRQDPFIAVRRALLAHPVAERLVPDIRNEISGWDDTGSAKR